MKRIIFALLAFGLAAAHAGLVQARFAPVPGIAISGLYNTGVDSSGAAMALGTSAVDTHYVIDPSWHTVPMTNPPPGFLGAWLSQSASDPSRWIVPASVPGAGPDSTYSLTLSFDLTGFNPSTASFSGRWATDNSGDIYLNGSSISLGHSGAYNAWSSFSASSGFVAGINTLNFSIVNAAYDSANPVGLRVEFLASNVAAIPEPETYAMMLAGLGLLGFVARRRIRLSNV